jgi:hypothetical protein
MRARMSKLMFLLLLLPNLAVAIPYTITFDLIGVTGPLTGQAAVDSARAREQRSEGAFVEFVGPLVVDLTVSFAGIAYDESNVVADATLLVGTASGLPADLIFFGGRDVAGGRDEWFIALSAITENLSVYLPADDLISSFTGTQSGLAVVPEPHAAALLALMVGGLVLTRFILQKGVVVV